jgi:hypothetical protein
VKLFTTGATFTNKKLLFLIATLTVKKAFKGKSVMEELGESQHHVTEGEI